MEDEILKCPECGSEEVTVSHLQRFMANTGEHYCHSVKTHDANSEATCLKCQWLGRRDQLVHNAKLTGKPPDGQIDHINMIRSDNRACNLRLASIAENNRNRTMQSNNTAGHKGVSFHKGTGKYQAKICVNKRRISLGYFAEAASAAEAYQKAVGEHHGQFARFK